MIVKTETVGGKQIEVHKDSFGHRRYWAKVDGRALFQRGRIRVRMFATEAAARNAAVAEARP